MNSKILNELPYIELFDSFLSKDEIESMNLDLLTFEPSRGAKPSGISVVDDHRTSQTYYVDEPQFSFLKNKTINLLKKYLPNIEYNCLEDIQITKYQKDQYYKEHWDFFNVPPINNETNDRIATFIMYLNDGFEGGETYFPDLDLRVIPKTGSAIYFQYNYQGFVKNLKTKHIGETVTAGTKYIATIWIRNEDCKNDKNNR
jgi:prolyl 4-hydroxylase